ncbi:Probable kinetochore protein NDC80 [Trichuris trichiura]|uniref:Probable kinetochore protein NDC80 n=1 Tax=Trichuris trichiura TaxID=36087 RepID=A0A077Z2C2_TRITR|nr:Probable kinetochore protein NDC80 [Trichuris trichiura]
MIPTLETLSMLKREQVRCYEDIISLEKSSKDINAYLQRSVDQQDGLEAQLRNVERRMKDELAQKFNDLKERLDQVESELTNLIVAAENLYASYMQMMGPEIAFKRQVSELWDNICDFMQSALLLVVLNICILV